MHLSCYKIKFHYYYYLFSPLRRTSTFFTWCVSKNYKSCTDVTDIHLPRRSVSPFLGSLSSSPCSPFSSRIVFFFAVPLARSRRSVPSARSGEGIRLALCWSWVTSWRQLCQVYGRALFHWLRRMYLMRVTAWAATHLGGWSREGRRMRECNVVRIKGGIIGN